MGLRSSKPEKGSVTVSRVVSGAEDEAAPFLFLLQKTQNLQTICHRADRLVFVVSPHEDRTPTPKTAHIEMTSLIGFLRTENVKTFTREGHFMMYVTLPHKYVSSLVLGAMIEKLSSLPWVRHVRVAPLHSNAEFEDMDLQPGDFF